MGGERGRLCFSPLPEGVGDAARAAVEHLFYIAGKVRRLTLAGRALHTEAFMIPYYVVDAFADAPFAGNPAGVCLPEAPLVDELMQKIAAENNLPETAFVVKNGAAWDLRWFTPETEIDLCGHATLGTAFVLDLCAGASGPYVFRTKSGELRVVRKGDLLEMDFPSRPPVSVPVAPAMNEALGARVLEAHRSRDLVLVLESADAVRRLAPDMDKLQAVPDAFGVIVTAKGEGDADFISRFFAPGAGIPEDPVTGSAHSTLIPFWAERLSKKIMKARQLSSRGGTLFCELAGDRVKIAGAARLYLQGKIFVE